MTDNSSDRLRAATFEPPSANSRAAGTASDSSQYRTWIAISVGLVLLLLVIFVLPRFAVKTVIDDSVTTGLVTPGEQLAEESGRTAEATERSPFAEAQMAKARRAAQEVLQTLLETQSRLEARAADQWAAERFLEVSDMAAVGDDYYRQQDFSAAEQAYSRALNAMAELETRLGSEIDNRLDALLAAIDAGDEADARSISPLLQTMAPDSDAVLDAVARVAFMAEVATLEAAASAAAEAGDLQLAVSKIEEALRQDPAHVRLATLAKSYQAALLSQRFEDAMTLGFSLLNEQRFTQARLNFEIAQRLRPADETPLIALAQLNEAQTLSTLNSLLAEARRYSKEESWSEAAEAYLAVLEIDPSIVDAEEGLARARPLADLFSELDIILEKQARLVDPVVLKEAQSSLAEAESALSATPKKAPRLQQRVIEVRAAIAKASTPLPVTITSDGQTEITIKRVARLGSLTSRTVSLRPGQYQVLGSRDGYRDVLITANITSAQDNQIDIRCEEAIVR